MVLFILHILGSCANAKIVVPDFTFTALYPLLFFPPCDFDWGFLLVRLSTSIILVRSFRFAATLLLLSLFLMTTRKSATELFWILRIFCWMWKGRYFLVLGDLQAHSLHPPHLFFRPETSSFRITVVVQLFFSLKVVAS